MAVVERRSNRGLRDKDEGNSVEKAREGNVGQGRDSGLGSRPFPWNGAIVWSSEARGTGSEWKGKRLIGGWSGQVRDYDQMKTVV